MLPFQEDDPGALTFGALLTRLQELVGKRVAVTISSPGGETVASIRGVLSTPASTGVDQDFFSDKAFAVLSSGESESWIFVEKNGFETGCDYGEGVFYVMHGARVTVIPD